MVKIIFKIDGDVTIEQAEQSLKWLIQSYKDDDNSWLYKYERKILRKKRKEKLTKIMK